MSIKQYKQFFLIIGFLLIAFFAIFAGSAQPAKAQTGYQTSTFAAYQEFENGFMVWREDTGEILAFVRSMNSVHRFAEAAYDPLPENPVLDAPPHNRVKPVRGFGRVWGNFDYVRDQLGWGVASEFGYTADYQFHNPYSHYLYENITIPSGSTVTIYSDNSWSISEPYPPPWSTPTPQPPLSMQVVGAVQEFENGRMLYAAHTGTIWVLLNSGIAYTFHTNEYGSLPDNPVWSAAPYGFVKPILGFGKVWGNYAKIRHTLGWGIGYEYSYTMSITETHAVKSIQLPNGQWVKISTVGDWVYQ